MIKLRGILSNRLQSRAGDRNKKILLAGAAGVVAKFGSVAATFITMPVTLHYLGAERFGLWMTMSSLVAFLTFADFGVGNGLLSTVASANGRDDMARIKVLVSSAYFGLGFIALILLTAFAASYGLIPWADVFNVSDSVGSDEVGASVAVLIVCFALTIPLSIVARTQMGLQMGFISNLWQCGSSLLTLSAVLLAVQLSAPLPMLVLAYVGAPLLIHLLNSLVFFLYTRPDIAPKRNAIDIAALRMIAKIGVMFAVLQVLAAITYLSDNFIISHMLGPEYVAQYAVPEKLFALISTMVALLLAPLWPAYGEAFARGDKDWIRTSLRRTMVISGIVAASVSTVLVLASSNLIQLWIGDTIAPPALLLLGFGAWKTMESVGMALAMALNGLQLIAVQLLTGLVTAMMSVIVKIFMIGTFGLEVIPWVVLGSYLCCTYLPLLYIIRSRLRR